MAGMRRNTCLPAGGACELAGREGRHVNIASAKWVASRSLCDEYGSNEHAKQLKDMSLFVVIHLCARTRVSPKALNRFCSFAGLSFDSVLSELDPLLPRRSVLCCCSLPFLSCSIRT